MKKLIILIISLILIIGAVVFYFFFNTKKEVFVLSSTINAVPSSASLIIECRNFYALENNLRTRNDIWKKLAKTSVIDNINTHLRYLDAVFNKSNNLRNLLAENSLFISVHPLGKENFDCLYLIKLNNSFNESAFNDLISELVPDKSKITSRYYNNCKDRFF